MKNGDFIYVNLRNGKLIRFEQNFIYKLLYAKKFGKLVIKKGLNKING